MEKENTNIYVISIVAIVAIVGMIILFSGQKAVVVQGTPVNSIAENQGNNENLVGQAFKSKFVPKVAKVNIRNETNNLSLKRCHCTTPSHINIQCGVEWSHNENLWEWSQDTDFEYFSYDEQPVGLSSHQNMYGAFCMFENELIADTDCLMCGNYPEGQESCNNFCDQRLNNNIINEINSSLQLCVNYFVEHCEGQVFINGAYDNDHHPEGWFDNYGVCSGQCYISKKVNNTIQQIR